MILTKVTLNTSSFYIYFDDKYSYVVKLTVEMRCKVTCMRWDSGEVMRTGELLPDGTPCSYDNEHHVCIMVKYKYILHIFH